MSTSIVDTAINILGAQYLGTLDGRVAFQKVALTIQMKRGKNTYRFRWGVYGPYSPTLSEEMHEKISELSKNNSLTEPNRDILNGVVNTAPDSGLNASELLEVAVSYKWAVIVLGLNTDDAVEYITIDERKADFVKKVTGMAVAPTNYLDQSTKLGELYTSIATVLLPLSH